MMDDFQRQIHKYTVTSESPMCLAVSRGIIGYNLNSILFIESYISTTVLLTPHFNSRYNIVPLLVKANLNFVRDHVGLKLAVAMSFNKAKIRKLVPELGSFLLIVAA